MSDRNATARLLKVLPRYPDPGIRPGIAAAQANMSEREASPVLRQLRAAGIVRNDGGWWTRVR